ncbi:molybdopterin-dependent oxidoreductase [Parafrigoribacterium mesophilum]|uniref:molybdopterin-dependent oxidoreductase n=1 Tax=Parafrigoribacterium mesophilum TaxID=433646 RepID=UPI0031FCBDDB
MRLTRATLERAALSGIAAAVAGLGVAELAAALVASTSSPLFVVGSFVIDFMPGAVKELAISLLGHADKPVLIASLAVLVAALSAVAGILELRRPPFGRVLLVLLAAVAATTAITRADAGVLAFVPGAVAALVSVLVLSWLMGRLRNPDTPPGPAGGLARRGFLTVVTATAGAGVLALAVGRVLGAGSQVAVKARALFTLPGAAVDATPLPAPLNVTGITPFITPNAAFYRIDTALQVPKLNPDDWSLTIDGMVDHPFTLSFHELIALPLEESRTTLACVSNYVGGNLIGTATWLGYPIRRLLQRAGPRPDTDMVLSTSSDGFTAGTPLTALTDERNAILAVGMNGEPLPFEHGYPVRMVVPGLYGYVSATKWVTKLKVTRFDRDTAYWTHQGWSPRGPVKLSSRIDVPAAGATVEAGTVAVAGVAWRQHVGVSAVQVRVDDGPFRDAELGAVESADTWRQWVYRWRATPGRHTITVRATDANGAVQTARVADVVPDGATGLHSVEVTVT